MTQHQDPTRRTLPVFGRDPGDVLMIDGDTGRGHTAQEVGELADALREQGAQLAFLFADQSVRSVTRLLALLEARIPVLLLDPDTDPAAAQRLLDRYRPDLVLAPGRGHPASQMLPGPAVTPDGVWVSPDGPGAPTHPELAVLLPTSGSTGSPKLVRLALRNITANARAIAASLRLVASDRAVTSLPVFYSYGMSLITSHVMAGSSILVSSRSVLDREFWSAIDEHAVTHLAGVPQTYLMLRRLRFASRELPHLRALMQAGGALDPEVIAEFAAAGAERNRSFFVMYGQTEASPRMACLPPERLADKLGSVGLPLEGGRFTIRGEDGSPLPAGEVGEIHYSGPNVSMGYAESRADLARGDDFQGRLATGDLGYLDDEGFLYLTGRSKRITKISGVRVSLDDIERLLGAIAPVAAVANDEDGVSVFTACTDADAVKEARRRLARDLRAPIQLISILSVPELPLLPSGKVDYATLRDRAGRAPGVQ